MFDELRVTEILPSRDWGDEWEEYNSAIAWNSALDAAGRALAKDFTHADWELLAVSDLAPYVDERYEKPRAAQSRGEEVLAKLHKTLFGTWPDAECRECR